MILFPFESVPKGSRIILYGAGNCGKSFFRQIVNSQYCDLKLWVARDYQKFKSAPDRFGCTYPVNEIKTIKTVDAYDYIVIAIVDTKVSKEVRDMLLTDYGVPQEKIISAVHEFAEDTVYGNYKNEYQELQGESDEIKLVKPTVVIRANELSIMPRYLLARDIKNGVTNEAHISLYKRTILAQSDIFTGSNYFSQRAQKNSVDDFLREFRNLVESIDVSDFERENYVPVTTGNRIVLDGQHRIAASLAQEKEIWIKYYPDSSAYGDGFGFSWFLKNGFNVEDMQRILYAYGCNYPHCGIFVFFATMMNQWEYFLAQIEKNCTVVGYVDLDFSRDYIGFENVIRAIYFDPMWRNVQIHLKTRLLKFSPLRLRVVLVSNEKDTSKDIFRTIRETKLLLREAVSDSVEVDSGAVMHASDTFAEYVQLRDLLLSPNQIRNISRMTQRSWRKSFIERLDKLKAFLNENGIRQEDAIVVGGSVLEVFGLRESDDLDITFKSNFRAKFGAEMQKVTDDIDICRQDNVIGENATVYRDDILIEDDDLHFLFYGLKFLNIEILKSKKKHDGRPKDLEDVRLIDIFEEYATNFDDKLVLRKQIDRELHLKRF